LIVAYTDAASTVTYRVMVWDGLDFAFGNDLTPGGTRETASVSFGHGATVFARTAGLTIVAGDGTASGSDRIAVSNQADIQNCLDGSSGGRWDNDTLTINLPASTATTTVQLFSDPGANPDSLLSVAAMLRVPVDAADASAGNDCRPPPPALLGPPPPVDPPPALSNLRVKPKAFVPAAKKSATRISYTSSGAARVTFRVERVSKGARVGKACVKRTASNSKRKACSRFVPLAGSFSHAAQAGPNSLPFNGRLGKSS
jgi:hypothetical protein